MFDYVKVILSYFSTKEETQKINNIINKMDQSIILEKKEIEKMIKEKETTKSAKQVVNDLYKKLESV